MSTRQNYKTILVNILLILIISSCSSTKNEPSQFKIRFLTWGSLPFKKEIAEDAINQKILYAIRKKFKNYSEIANEISVSLDTIKERIGLLSQLDLVTSDGVSTDKWIANMPIYDEKEMFLAERICLKYAKREVDIIHDSLKKIQELYRSLAISEYFDWDRMSWIVIGAFISDLIVIDRIRFFPEYRDEQYLPQLHPGGSRWSLTGYVNLHNISYKKIKWSFYQAWVRDETAGFSEFGYYKPKENRIKPPKNPLYLALSDDGDILFNINNKALSFEDIQNVTGMHQDTLKKRIDFLSSLDPPAILKTNDKYISNIPIFAKLDFEKLLLLADKIAAKIHLDVIVPCKTELTKKGQKIGLRYPLPDGVLIRDAALKLLADEGILPAVPSPPVPWNFGVWGWEGQLLLWDEVNDGDIT